MCICPTLFFGPLPVTFWLPHPPSPFLHPRGSTRLPEFQLPELWPRNSLQVGSWLATRTVIESLSLKSLSYAAWCPMSEKSLFHIFCPFLVALFSSVQSLSCVWLCNPMNCSMPGLPVHHQLPESSQTHVHLVGDAIQPSHPLSSPSPPALNLSQHQGLLKWVSSLHQVAKILEFQPQHQSLQWTLRTDLL